LKALCEAAAEREMPGRVLTVRPGLIVGPWDPTDRFGYWPRRIAAGGDVLLPGGHDRPVQFIDARDLAAWIRRSAGRRLVGTFNASGPAHRFTMGELFAACERAAGSGARPVWTGERLLVDAGVEPWSELPLWVGEGVDPDARGFMLVSSARAIADGLEFRPVVDTVADTLAWERANPGHASTAVLQPEREAELLRSMGPG
jgi:2'-hydroxyisoflavone reductase